MYSIRTTLYSFDSNAHTAEGEDVIAIAAERVHLEYSPSILLHSEQNECKDSIETLL